MTDRTRYRLPAPPPRRRGLWPSLRGLISPAERAKRQLEKGYQQEAERRLRESGLARA